MAIDLTSVKADFFASLQRIAARMTEDADIISKLEIIHSAFNIATVITPADFVGPYRHMDSALITEFMVGMAQVHNKLNTAFLTSCLKCAGKP